MKTYFILMMMMFCLHKWLINRSSASQNRKYFSRQKHAKTWHKCSMWVKWVIGMKYSGITNYYKRIIHGSLTCLTVEVSGVHIGPLRERKPLGLRSPSGDVRGVKIPPPPNINLSKGLRSPWTVPKNWTHYNCVVTTPEYITQQYIIIVLNNLSLWPESNHWEHFNPTTIYILLQLF